MRTYLTNTLIRKFQNSYSVGKTPFLSSNLNQQFQFFIQTKQFRLNKEGADSTKSCFSEIAIFESLPLYFLFLHLNISRLNKGTLSKYSPL